MDDGEMSERDVWVACDAIYDVITGLASWEDTNIVYGVRNGLSK